MATPPLVQRKASLPIHFFKTILESNVEWMKIPNKFTRRYGGGLSNPVFLRPPDSKEWEVHWTKENGEVWFQKGWKEFVEYYSLEHGHFVLFKYNGTSLIDVLILDRSAIEIDDEMGTVDPNVEKLHADKGVRSDHHQTKVRVRPRSPLVSSEPRNKMPSEKAIERTSSLNTPKLLRAKKVARNFVSNNVFFTVVITRPQLEEGAWSWSVKLPNCRTISCGWCLFARENVLQIRNVCIFELISTKDAVFKVPCFQKSNLIHTLVGAFSSWRILNKYHFPLEWGKSP
ncbi:B3 domain-containing transcription factor VRN1 [Glycine soja]|nr:B3 domain-containing transcription factor VRN1 [Glycine soja]